MAAPAERLQIRGIPELRIVRPSDRNHMVDVGRAHDAIGAPTHHAGRMLLEMPCAKAAPPGRVVATGAARAAANVALAVTDEAPAGNQRPARRAAVRRHHGHQRHRRALRTALRIVAIVWVNSMSPIAVQGRGPWPLPAELVSGLFSVVVVCSGRARARAARGSSSQDGSRTVKGRIGCTVCRLVACNAVVAALHAGRGAPDAVTGGGSGSLTALHAVTTGSVAALHAVTWDGCARSSR